MSMERSRRARFTNVVPTAGEFTVAVLVAGLFLLVVTPMVVQALVGWTTTGVFAVPKGNLWEAYGGLLRGRFGAGLPNGVADGLPSDRVMWGLTVLGEVLVLGAGVVAGMWLRELTGTSSRHGLATSTQAAEALGVPRLRASAAVIRPDLYARGGRRARTTRGWGPSRPERNPRP